MYLRRAFSRSISAMASSGATTSLFTRTVVEAMRNLYPERFADSSFDNTGLLLEAPQRPNHLKPSVLLTIDLTKAVADEAIERKDSIIIAYHPIIFRGLKSLSLGNSQQNSLLRLAQEGINVYCPHTAVDAVPGGLNDWLADIVTDQGPGLSSRSSLAPHIRSTITPIKDAPSGFENAGYGRIVRFHSPQTLGEIVTRVVSGLECVSGVSVAVPQSVPTGKKSDFKISSVGICAGSGGSMLGGLDVDLLFTGELSHHEGLAAIEQGKCIITTFHSNTERAFLRKRMKINLMHEIEIQSMDGALADLYEPDEVDKRDWSVAVSQVDKDPFDIVMKDQSGW